jgi:hypothetical protein
MKRVVAILGLLFIASPASADCMKSAFAVAEGKLWNMATANGQTPGLVLVGEQNVVVTELSNEKQDYQFTGYVVSAQYKINVEMSRSCLVGIVEITEDGRAK